MIGAVLNKIFGHAYVKNLHNSNERMKSFDDSAKNIGLSYDRIEAIDGTKFVDTGYNFMHGRHHIKYPASGGFYGSQLTAEIILMQEISKESESHMVFDDDTIFYEWEEDLDFSLLVPPDDWDIVILGGINDSRKNSKEIFFKKIINKGNNFSSDINPLVAGCHGIAINSKVYLDLFNILKEKKFWGDHAINHLIDMEKNVYLIYPHLLYQNRKLFSDINKIHHKN
jgi:hypothetical protein